MFTFNHPIYFLLLFPVALLAGRLRRQSPAGRLLFASFFDIPRRRTWRVALAGMATPLFIAALALSVTALARPQRLSVLEQRTTDAVAIQMVLDISGSMAQPFFHSAGIEAAGTPRPPTRLETAKQCFSAFVQQRPADLIGLITFAGYAVTRAPLTADHAALRAVLETVDLPGRGEAAEQLRADELLTALGDAIATGCARLRKAEPRAKVMILLTDGGANAGATDPEEAAQAARQLGIRIYTIGVADRSAPDPSEEETTPPDVARLRNIASRTGGMYFEADSAQGLAAALTDIDALEKTRVIHSTRYRRRELFPFALIPALGLMLATITINLTLRRRLI